jgi:hypothetical protein
MLERLPLTQLCLMDWTLFTKFLTFIIPVPVPIHNLNLERRIAQMPHPLPVVII